MPTQSIAEREYFTPFTDVAYAELPTSTDEQQGMYRDVKELQIGYGSEVLRASRQGLWLGAERFEDAPFSVDMQGNITAVSLDLTGFLEIGGAAADINGHSTTVSGGKITANSIVASKLSVSTLSSITADIGSITAGSITGVTITGGTVRTSSGSTRVEMSGSNNWLAIYKSSDLRAIFFDQGVFFYDSSGNDTGSVYAASDTLFLDASNSTGRIALSAGSSGYATFAINSTNYFYASGSLGYNVSPKDIVPVSSAQLGRSGAAWLEGHFDDIAVDNILLDRNLYVDNGSIDIDTGFLNLAQMSGATADARSDFRDGSMYYRTDGTDVIRVLINGTWRTITTT